MNDEFEPLIVNFCCNWCSYTGADLAGVSRLQYPPNIRIIRVMCSSMIHLNLIIDALTKGADGVLVCGCHIGDCHMKMEMKKLRKEPKQSALCWKILAWKRRDFDWNGFRHPKARDLHRWLKSLQSRLKSWGQALTKCKTEGAFHA